MVEEVVGVRKTWELWIYCFTVFGVDAIENPMKCTLREPSFGYWARKKPPYA
jgi:hypothetical protein